MSFAHEPVPSKSPTRCIQTDHYWVPCRCKVKTPTCVYFGSWDLVDVPLDDNESCVANPPACASHDNLTAMIHLSPPCLLHALALRFAAKQIYTSCGSMLLSINPYHTIPGMYGDAQAKQYKTRLGNEASPPHLFSTAQTAMDALVKTENQPIHSHFGGVRRRQDGRHQVHFGVPGRQNTTPSRPWCSRPIPCLNFLATRPPCGTTTPHALAST